MPDNSGGYYNPAANPPAAPPAPPIRQGAPGPWKPGTPVQPPYVPSAYVDAATAPGGPLSQLNATFPNQQNSNYGYQAPAQPNYGGGGGGAGPAAPAVDPNWNPPPNKGDWFLPDSEGPTAQNPLGGHWVHGGPDTSQPPAGGAPGASPAGQGGPGFAPTFYAPTTDSPYLTLPQNWLAFVDPTMRQQLQQQLQQMHFNPTGDVGQYGEQMYTRPSQFNIQDLNQIADPAIRQWLRFFLGNLGYGISYQLPSTPTAPGIPTAPPNPTYPNPNMNPPTGGHPIGPY